MDISSTELKPLPVLYPLDKNNCMMQMQTLNDLSNVLGVYEIFPVFKVAYIGEECLLQNTQNKKGLLSYQNTIL